MSEANFPRVLHNAYVNIDTISMCVCFFKCNNNEQLLFVRVKSEIADNSII